MRTTGVLIRESSGFMYLMVVMGALNGHFGTLEDYYLMRILAGGSDMIKIMILGAIPLPNSRQKREKYRSCRLEASVWFESDFMPKIILFGMNQNHSSRILLFWLINYLRWLDCSKFGLKLTKNRRREYHFRW